jgi:hypothetical protein
MLSWKGLKVDTWDPCTYEDVMRGCTIGGAPRILIDAKWSRRVSFMLLQKEPLPSTEYEAGWGHQPVWMC